MHTPLTSAKTGIQFSPVSMIQITLPILLQSISWYLHFLQFSASLNCLKCLLLIGQMAVDSVDLVVHRLISSTTESQKCLCSFKSASSCSLLGQTQQPATCKSALAEIEDVRTSWM